ncbi:Maf family protein [Anaerofustis stercorihominis]|uniref:Maf family protein n=1 Tax=Anaerofustis stercorihominis TaxID=214853 RepID=UPI00214B5613|nr:Maf family protein [Anaerofustis stercorihominis]MCR2032852.1 Maf family protein [Anaerofustis stercorihominis]
MKKIILASASPRRKELLKLLDIDFDIIVSNCEEVFDDELSVYENLKNIAYLKAYDVFKDNNDKLVIGADTVVYSDGRVLLKPKDKDDAREMIKFLSGKTHSVISGISVITKEKNISTAVETKVTFKELDDKEIEEYINTNEPYDKAGGYAVQGIAGKFISKIEGDYFNVVGLSISTLYDMLKEFR